MPSKEITIEPTESRCIRLDAYIASIGLLTRGQIRARELKAFKGGVEVKLSQKVSGGEVYTVTWNSADLPSQTPEDIPLEALYEDDNLLVINKQQGLVVHPGDGHQRGTLVHALLNLFENSDEWEDPLRPGIVHRLDKDTSGVMVVAKKPGYFNFLVDQFRNREVSKGYLALVKGAPAKRSGKIQTYIRRNPSNRKLFSVSRQDGKEAVTLYTVLKVWERFSLVKVEPQSGRTHQIRVHMKHIGCPILGDPLYSRKESRFPNATMMLHSWYLEIKIKEGERRRFLAPLPPHFQKTIKSIREGR